MSAALIDGFVAEGSADVRYVVASTPLFRFLGDGMVEVHTTKKLLVPQEVFRALMTFEEPRTIAEAHARTSNLTPDELETIVEMLVDRELLARVLPAHMAALPEDVEVEGTRFSDLFRPGVFDDPEAFAVMSGHLAAGRALVIPDALRPDLAERIHAELYSDDLKWQVIEEFDQISHFRFRSLDFERHLPPSALEVRSVARAPSTKEMIARLSGRDCSGHLEFGSSWYRGGDYTHPHDDAQPHRSVAAVLNLSKDFSPEWGGSLFWAPNGTYIEPRFNTLTLFNVSLAAVHQVIPVSPLAHRKRLTLNMWWCNRTPPPRIDKALKKKSRANHAGVTPHAYGTAPEQLAHRIMAV